MTRFVVLLIAAVASISALGQRKSDRMQVATPPKGTVCYASAKNENTYIGPPAEYLKAKARQSVGRTKSANIVVTYEGFTTEARQAFQAAVDIWEAILETPVTIHVRATWEPLSEGVLGSASPGTYIANFNGTPKRNTWYPIALAEKIAGEEINDPDEADIEASFSSSMDWHYDVGTPAPGDTYDLVSIVLHEIGHGLGITHGYTIENGLGGIPTYFTGRPVVYETNIDTGLGQNLVDDFTPPSAAIRSAMTSGNLFFASRIVRTENLGANAKLYAPAFYNPGSSIAHLDEATYPAGTANSLMTPFIGAAERIHDPGPISRSILNEMGWFSTVVQHTALKSIENATGPFHVVAKVISDGHKDSVVVAYKITATGKFNGVFLTPTGNANEFAGDIPGGSLKYWYYIGVRDNYEGTLTNPGKIVKPGSDTEQGLIYFETGPDNQTPFINHIPREFITKNDDLALQAIISDNLGVESAVVEYKINGASQTNLPMTLKVDTDSTYDATVDFAIPLNVGDKIEYRLRAEDISIAGNVSYKPSSTTYFEVNVAGLGETEDSYANDFNDLSSQDFFGNGFSVSKPANFNNGAIHTTHPYPAGGAEGTHVDLIYNLKTPIRISSTDAIMKFDEIVLVEPGESGVPWPSDDFYDYVVVEGSTDGGETWVAVADGYDSRITTAFENAWNGSQSENNSTAVGTPSMYRSHSFDLLQKFQASDEVALRFRLFSDPFSFGWGWSIDNLKIQIDDTPPLIRHKHIDYLLEGTTSVDLVMNVTDANGVEELFVDYNINGGPVSTIVAVLNPALNDYTITIDLASLGMSTYDEFRYKIRTTDGRGNTGTLPATGDIAATIISLTNPIDEFVSDFNSDNTDVIGNYFTRQQPTGFTSPGMTTAHPYDLGFGPDGSSDFSWMVKKPIKIGADNTIIYYEDVLIAEYDVASFSKDYIEIEGSKDGVTWTSFEGGYNSDRVIGWRNAFDNGADGSSSLVQKQSIDLRTDGHFKTGDLVLVRFRFHSNAAINGWGWHVDNLSIQGPITAVETQTSAGSFDAWPNPVAQGSVYLKLALPNASDVSVEFLTMQGQLLSSDRFSAPSGDFQRQYSVDNWPDGFYIVRVSSDFGTSVRKLIKVR